MPIDAERWLAARGVPREAVVGLDAAPSQDDGPEPSASAPSGVEAGSPPPRPAEVVDLARQSAADAAVVSAAGDGAVGTPAEDSAAFAARSDDVDAALAFVRRSTSNAPQSEGRLRSKLADRGHDAATIELALERARAQRLVDDDALLQALIAERRARGHADVRLRRDLRDRGFGGVQVDEALARWSDPDPAAAAFAVAREQAARHGGVDAETAVRRTVGALVRRGHGEALARKAARDAVYAAREGRASAER